MDTVAMMGSVTSGMMAAARCRAAASAAAMEGSASSSRAEARRAGSLRSMLQWGFTFMTS